jgi:hypothetical protein
MFSLKHGTPIAFIEGGEYNGKILGLVKTEDPEYEVYEQDPEDIIAELLDTKDHDTRRTYSRKDIEEVTERIKEDEPPPKNRMRIARLYNEAKILLREREGKEIILYEGRMIPLPVENVDEEQNERIYIAGSTGSGKSTYINSWLKMYLKANRAAKIFVFSKKDADKSLDQGIPPRNMFRIALDESFLEDDPLTTDDIKDPRGGRTCVVFDDIESVPNKDVLKEVKRLRDELLETGRSDKIDIIVVAHQIMDWKNTRTIINESSSVTVFPGNGTAHSIDSFFNKYFGFDRPMRKRILALPSRWVTISKNAPRYVLFEKGAFLVK